MTDGTVSPAGTVANDALSKPVEGRKAVGDVSGRMAMEQLLNDARIGETATAEGASAAAEAGETGTATTTAQAKAAVDAAGTDYQKAVEDETTRERMVTALTGKTRSERSDAQNERVDAFIDDMARNGLPKVDARAAGATSEDDIASGDVEGDALPEAVSGAYAAEGGEAGKGTILLADWLDGDGRAEAAREEMGEAFAQAARSAGVTVAAGDAGARTAKALDGASVDAKTDPALFEAQASDVGRITVDGKVVDAKMDRLGSEYARAISQANSIKISESVSANTGTQLDNMKASGRVLAREMSRFATAADALVERVNKTGKLNARERSALNSLGNDLRNRLRDVSENMVRHAMQTTKNLARNGDIAAQPITPAQALGLVGFVLGSMAGAATPILGAAGVAGAVAAVTATMEGLGIGNMSQIEDGLGLRWSKTQIGNNGKKLNGFVQMLKRRGLSSAGGVRNALNSMKHIGKRVTQEATMVEQMAKILDTDGGETQNRGAQGRLTSGRYIPLVEATRKLRAIGYTVDRGGRGDRFRNNSDTSGTFHLSNAKSNAGSGSGPRVGLSVIAANNSAGRKGGQFGRIDDRQSNPFDFVARYKW